MLAISAQFWGIRVLYWTQISEAPFSDLRDYVDVGRNIYEHFFWGASPAYPTYFAPTTPAFIALSMLIGGEAGYEWVFRFLVQGITFAGIILLALEIIRVTQCRYFGYALLVIVALCRPSVFWSYKTGTEPVSEALLLLTIALALRALRTHGWRSAMLAAMTGTALGLGRPQFLPAVFLMGLTLALWIGRTGSPDSRRILGFAPMPSIRQGLAFGIGMLIVWTPWVVRNYQITHDIVPLGTSGAESFLWEFGGSAIGRQTYTSLTLSDGSVVTEFGRLALRRRVAHLPTDFERNKQMQLVAKAWIAANWRDLPALALARLIHYTRARGASGLTVVSRERLFGEKDPPDSFTISRVLNALLFDKSAATSWITVAGGLIAIITLRGAGLILANMAIVPAITAAFVVSIERAVESMISLQLWLAFFAMATVAFRLAQPTAVIWRLKTSITERSKWIHIDLRRLLCIKFKR